MRKVVCLFFITVLFLNLFSYVISFTVQRYSLHAEVEQMQQQHKVKNACHFVFTKQQYAQLSKLDGGNEFCYKGDIYDILHSEWRDGKLQVTAYYDHQETSLVGQLVDFFNEKDEPGNKHTVPEFTLLDFVIEETGYTCYSNTVCFKLPLTPSEILSRSLNLDSPPPDTTSC